MIVAIDGPAGAGKSTVARLVARRVGAAYLNTGAMYRAVALLAGRAGVDPADGAGLTALARAHAIRLEPVAGGERVLVDGEDVTDGVRAADVTAAVSAVAGHGDLRREIVTQQRAILRAGDWVVDGRDIGTVVAPQAELKVFLTAAPAERARRRHAEMVAGGQDVELGDVLQQIAERDREDSTRAESPLQVAPGARVVDTTGRSVDEVVGELAAMVTRLRGGG